MESADNRTNGDEFKDVCLSCWSGVYRGLGARVAIQKPGRLAWQLWAFLAWADMALASIVAVEAALQSVEGGVRGRSQARLV